MISFNTAGQKIRARISLDWAASTAAGWGYGRPGTTLIELLITILVLAIIVTIVGNVYIGSSRFTRDEQLRIDVGENAARIFSTTDQTLRQAKAVLANASLSGTNYTTDTDTLVFSLPSLVGGQPSPVEIDTGVIQVDTSLPDNPRLRLLIEPDATSEREAADRILIEQVKDVYFRYTSPIPTNSTVVTVTVTIEELVNNRSFSRANLLYASFRNHP
jgi:type II secretory pathway pseudopilin PulG